jgi:hypothetical protein
MGTQVMRDQKIWFDGYDLTGQLNSVSVQAEADMKDATVFGNDTRINAAGLKIPAIGAAGFWDGAPTDAALFGAVGVDGKLVTVANAAAAGSPAYMLNAMVGKYSYDGQVGELFGFKLEAASQAALVRGIVAENRTSLAASGVGTARQLGAIPAGKKLYAGLHILNAGGTTPSLTVTLKSDVTNAFVGAETTRLTFAAATTKGCQYQELAVAVTDTWWKPSFTVSGTTPSFDFALILAIQ